MSKRVYRNLLEERIRRLKTEYSETKLYGVGMPYVNIYGQRNPHVWTMMEIEAYIENYEREIVKLGNIELQEVFGEWTEFVINRFPEIGISTIVQKVPLDAFDGGLYREIAQDGYEVGADPDLEQATLKMRYITYDMARFAFHITDDSYDSYLVGYSVELDKLVYYYIPEFY